MPTPFEQASSEEQDQQLRREVNILTAGLVGRKGQPSLEDLLPFHKAWLEYLQRFAMGRIAPRATTPATTTSAQPSPEDIIKSQTFRRLVVKQANRKSQNQQFNRGVQNYFYKVLENAPESAAKKSLAVLIELWQRQVWRDAKTVNVIGMSLTLLIIQYSTVPQIGLYSRLAWPVICHSALVTESSVLNS